MATRMQQRRGTSSQWTSANPVLNAGEMGWESDTNKFKIGDGTNHWADLDYFVDTNSTINPSFGTSIVFEGATSNDYETTLQVTDPTADRTITLPNATGTVVLADGSGNVTVSGNLNVQGTTTTVDSTTINVVNSFTFEGSTPNSYETVLQVEDPTQDRTITLPDSTGTVILDGSTQTLTNKTLTFSTNYITGTVGEFNNAVTDGNFASLDGIETLTNKTLLNPSVSGLNILSDSIVFEGTTEDAHETTLVVSDPSSDRTITIPNASGTVITTGNLSDINSLGTVNTIVFEGSTTDEFEVTLSGGDPTADRSIQLPDAGGTLVVDSAAQTLTNKTLTSPAISGLSITDSSIIIEGSTDNGFETTITVVDPTEDRIITIPNVTGTVITTGNLADITSVGVLNSSVVFEGTTEDGHELTLTAGDPTADRTVSFPDESGAIVLDGATQTLTNKTLTSPQISGLSITDGSIVLEGSSPDNFETTLTVTDPTEDRVISFPDVTGTVITSGDTNTVTSTMIKDGTIVDGDINASAAIAWDKLAISSTVDSTEIGYVNGVTSSIQTQLDSKLGSSTATSTYAPIANPTFTGTVAGVTKSMVGLGDVDNTSDSAKPVSTAQQTALNGKLNLSGGTLTGALTLSGAPTSDLHAATKLYVDNVTAGINFHEAVHAASTTNLATNYNNGTDGVGATLTADTNRAFATLDGESVTLGQRVLIKNQTDGKQNGIYTLTTVGSVSAPWVLTRATDADNNPTGEMKTGDFVLVLNGTVNASIGYINNTTANPIVIGTDNISYTEFSAGKTVIAGSGLAELTPGTLSVATGGITTAMLAAGAVIDVDVAADAAIAQSKIANLTTDLAAKAPLSSPTFTGTVTVAASGIAFTDGTQIAEGVPSRTVIIQRTASNTLSGVERDDLIEMASSSAMTLTIPADSTFNFPIGTSMDVLQTSTGQVTIAGAVGVTVNATPGLKLRTQWSSATLFKRAANTWVVYGDLTA